MLDYLAKSSRLELGRDRMLIYPGRGLFGRRMVAQGGIEFAAETAGQPEQFAELLSNLFKRFGCEKTALRVVLSDEHVRYFTVMPPVNSRSRGDIHAAAALRFQSLFDEPSPAWEISADWSAARPFLACATPKPLLAALHHGAARQGVKIVQIVPRLTFEYIRWRKAFKKDAWIAVAHGGRLSVGALFHGNLHAVSSFAVRQEHWADESWLPGQLRKEAWRLNLPMPAKIGLAGDIPGTWAQRDLQGLACMRLGKPAQTAFPATKVGPVGERNSAVSSGEGAG